MTTANDVIEETQRLLLGGQREELNKLAANVTADATDLTFQFDLGGILPGTSVSIDLETYRVWSVNDSTKTATVEPGMQGTTSAAHTEGALVHVNPKMSRAAIFKAINDELRALSSPSNGLFQIKSMAFDYSAAVTDYNLSADVMDVYEVRMAYPGPERDWMSMPNWSYKPVSDAATFASGNALHLPGGYPGRGISVLYKAGFTPLTNLDDDIAEVSGLPEEAHDILALGCLLRLGPVREIRRNFTDSQGDTRRAEEVPPNAVSTSFNSVRQLYAQRLTAEAGRLANKYPMRHR